MEITVVTKINDFHSVSKCYKLCVDFHAYTLYTSARTTTEILVKESDFHFSPVASESFAWNIHKEMKLVESDKQYLSFCSYLVASGFHKPES